MTKSLNFDLMYLPQFFTFFDNKKSITRGMLQPTIQQRLATIGLGLTFLFFHIPHNNKSMFFPQHAASQQNHADNLIEHIMTRL